MNSTKAIKLVRSASNDPEAKKLLKKEWREANEDSDIASTGFCSLFTEAVFVLIGGWESEYHPMMAHVEGGTHWWLQNEQGETIDPTADQIDNDDDRKEIYAGGEDMTKWYKGWGNYPSKKCQKFLELIGQK